MNNLGTWIDWQYLHNAAKLLAKVLHVYRGSKLNTDRGKKMDIISLQFFKKPNKSSHDFFFFFASQTYKTEFKL